MVLATRDVFERALRDRLLAMHRNVKNRTGAVVTGLEHGDGDATGCVTGEEVLREMHRDQQRTHRRRTGASCSLL